MKKRKGCPQGQVKNPTSDCFEGIGKGSVVPGAESLGPGDQGGAGQKTDEHAAQRTYPMIVNGQLEKPGHANEHGENANAVEPLRSDSVFERTVGGGLWRGRRSE